LALSEKAWKHISQRHPELSKYKSLVNDSIATPDFILKGGQGEMKAVKLFTTTHLGSKYLVVIYREDRGRKAIITAYFTSDLKRIKRVNWYGKPSHQA
jgi:hypothetical protein